MVTKNAIPRLGGVDTALLNWLIKKREKNPLFLFNTALAAVVIEIPNEVNSMKAKTFARPLYELYVTKTPFEFPGFLPSVDKDTYEEYGVTESESYYIALSEPSFNIEEYLTHPFKIAKEGDEYEDDYTKVEVLADRIIYVEK